MRIVPVSTARKPWRTPVVKVQTFKARARIDLAEPGADGPGPPDTPVTAFSPAALRFASR